MLLPVNTIQTSLTFKVMFSNIEMTGNWTYPSSTVLENVYLCPPPTFMNKCIIMDYEMIFERLKTSMFYYYKCPNIYLHFQPS